MGGMGPLFGWVEEVEKDACSGHWAAMDCSHPADPSTPLLLPAFPHPYPNPQGLMLWKPWGFPGTPRRPGELPQSPNRNLTEVPPKAGQGISRPPFYLSKIDSHHSDFSTVRVRLGSRWPCSNPLLFSQARLVFVLLAT